MSRDTVYVRAVCVRGAAMTLVPPAGKSLDQTLYGTLRLAREAHAR